jgi:hypothetical protein
MVVCAMVCGREDLGSRMENMNEVEKEKGEA